MELRISLACLLLCVSIASTQDIDSNTIDDQDYSKNKVDYNKHNKVDDDPNPFAEAAQAFLNGNKGPDLGGMLGTFMQSEEGKQLGGMLMGAAVNNGGAGQLLSGLGSMLGSNSNQGGLDPALIGNVLGMLADSGNTGSKKTADEGLDIGNLMSMASSLFQNSGMTAESTMDLLPQLLSTFSAFVGPEARDRELGHQGHAWFMPPILEKAHILFDHFAHSDLGKGLWKVLGADKFFNTFSKDGRFDFNKFFELLENQSFRRHWIQRLTQRLTDIIAIVSDPKTHKK